MASCTYQNLTIRRPSPTTTHYSVTNHPIPRTTSGFILSLLADIFRLFAVVWTSLITYMVLHQQWQQHWQLLSHIQQDTPTTPGIIPQQNNTSTHASSSSSSSTLLSDMLSKSITREHITSALKLPLTLFLASSSPQTQPQQPQQPQPHLPALIIVLLGTSILLHTSRSTTETLLVLRTLGLQTSRTTTSFPILIHLTTALSNHQPLRSKLSAITITITITITSLVARMLSTTTTRFIPTCQIQDLLIHEGFVGWWAVVYYLGVVVRGEDGVVVVFERCLPRLGVVREVWGGVREVLWGDGDDDGRRGGVKT